MEMLVSRIEFFVTIGTSVVLLGGILTWLKKQLSKEFDLKFSDINGKVTGIQKDISEIKEKVTSIDRRLLLLEGKYQGNVDARISPIKRRQRKPNTSEV